jgi:hypothetical protein
MTLDKTQIDLIINDADYICSPKFNNSLKELLKRYPDGAPDRLIARVLGLSTKELDLVWANVVELLQGHFNLTQNDNHNQNQNEKLSHQSLPSE